MVARERRISRMRNQGVSQTDHERPWMLPNQPYELVDEQAPANPEAVASSKTLRVCSLPRSQLNPMMTGSA